MAQITRRTPAQIAQDNLNEARARRTVATHRQTMRREALERSDAEVKHLDKLIEALLEQPDLPPQPAEDPDNNSPEPQPDAELGDEAARTAGVATTTTPGTVPVTDSPQA